MKILRNILIVTLLAGLTCAVVFVPPFFSGQREDDVLNQVSYSSYDAVDRTKITSQQLAELYYNGEVVAVYNSVIDSEESFEDASEAMENLTDMLFSKDEATHKYIKELFVDCSINTKYSDNLINFENQPVALKFACRFMDNKTGYIQIVSEEKTNTILEFYMCITKSCFNSNEEMEEFIKSVDLLMAEYFKTELGLENYEYDSSISISEGQQDDQIYLVYVVRDSDY